MGLGDQLSLTTAVYIVHGASLGVSVVVRRAPDVVPHLAGGHGQHDELRKEFEVAEWHQRFRFQRNFFSVLTGRDLRHRRCIKLRFIEKSK